MCQAESSAVMWNGGRTILIPRGAKLAVDVGVDPRDGLCGRPTHAWRSGSVRHVRAEEVEEEEAWRRGWGCEEGMVVVVVLRAGDIERKDLVGRDRVVVERGLMTP